MNREEQSSDISLSSNVFSALTDFLSQQQIISNDNDKSIPLIRCPNNSDGSSDDLLTKAMKDIRSIMLSHKYGDDYKDDSFSVSSSNALEDNEDIEEEAARKSPELKYDSYHRINRSTSVNTSDGRPFLSTIRLALVVQHHSLWAEFVYNAARVLADRIDNGQINCNGLKCLELGAGAGLPALMSAVIDKPAREVVISDYGTIHDRSLIHAIDLNIEAIRPYCQSTVLMSGIEYIFGYPVEPLLRANGKASSSTSNGLDQKFDVIFLADLIFNRSEHRKLLWTVKHALAIDGVAWITFSHHDPLKSEKDLHFFELAASADEEFNFIVEFVDQEIRESYPFVEKDGMDAQRGIVYIYTLRHRKTTV